MMVRAVDLWYRLRWLDWLMVVVVAVVRVVGRCYSRWYATVGDDGVVY